MKSSPGWDVAPQSAELMELEGIGHLVYIEAFERFIGARSVSFHSIKVAENKSKVIQISSHSLMQQTKGAFCYPFSKKP